MRTDIAQPIRLKDYRPPDWLVETVALDVTLHPTQSKVRATLALKPNPQAAAAPLRVRQVITATEQMAWQHDSFWAIRGFRVIGGGEGV